MKLQPGILFSFEGIEGCGKTTQISLAATFLEGLGYRVLLTREPGATELGLEIRRLLLSPGFSPGVLSELLLYLADRHEHVSKIIRPHLEDGYLVLVDRFIDSTWVYQGYARQGDLRLIDYLNEVVTDKLKPVKTFLLDCEVEVGLRRARQRNLVEGKSGLEDRFDQFDLSFHQRIRDGFLQLARENQDRFLILNASLEVDEIQRMIRQLLVQALDLVRG